MFLNEKREARKQPSFLQKKKKKQTPVHKKLMLALYEFLSA
jgi:hypothetical protein